MRPSGPEPVTRGARVSDRITVRRIEFHGFHGVPAAEREIGHRYRVDLHMELDLRPGGRADDVALTVDYGEAARAVLEVGTGPTVQLVETLAERMAAAVLERFPLVDAVELEVAKLHPPVALPFAASVIRIRRTRGEG
jgi:7,8-dihydroneopterin aldolase/epimerase/oxygenase